MFSLLSRMKQIIILFFDAHLSNCQAVKNKRKVAMTIGMFSSTMPMFLTFLVNKLYKKWRKLFKFGGDKSMINFRIGIFEGIFIHWFYWIFWSNFVITFKNFWKVGCAQNAAGCIAAYRKVASSNTSRAGFSHCLWRGFSILTYCDLLTRERFPN